VRIRADGDVMADDGISVGKLRIVKFAQGAPLEKEGRNLFRAPAGAAPEDVTDPRLVEGAVERANVEPVSELASMVVLHRAFDVAMQVLQADDQATQKLIREVS
jgi:flagellar basal-body rod protein FlgG